MAKKGLLLVISGPSGVGKGTVCAGLLAKHPEISASLSSTTRSKRKGEVEGVHYNFITERVFQESIENAEFLEWAKVYNNYYGTRKQVVDEKISLGRDVLLEIDTVGAKHVKTHVPEAILIFIMPPNKGELARRLRGRATDSEEVIEKRLSCFEAELKEIGYYDYVVFNHNVQEAVKQVETIIQAEKSRVSYLYDDIAAMF
jgi:guanylate kinase